MHRYAGIKAPPISESAHRLTGISIWDEKAQKKVQKKRCIGKIDPETDEIIPTGKRGRPRREKSLAKEPETHEHAEYAKILSEARALCSRLKTAEASFKKLSSEFQSISADLDDLISRMQ